MNAGAAPVACTPALFATWAVVVQEHTLACGIGFAVVVRVHAEALTPLRDQLIGVWPVARFGKGVQVVARQLLDLGLGGQPAGPAMRAHPAHEALGQHAEQGVTEVERVHAHVQQPGHGLWRAVGVQRGHHKVARQRGLDRGLGGFLVADFADHDHVWVGAQERAQGLGKSPVDLGVDLHLPQALLRDFDRVFGRPDLAVRPVDEAECRVQGGGLARTGRAHAQEHAVRPLHDVLHPREVVG